MDDDMLDGADGELEVIAVEIMGFCVINKGNWRDWWDSCKCWVSCL